MRALDTLPLAVDRQDDIPVGVQLAWKLRAAIASGKLMRTDQLPSVRDLAKLSGVNVNTARAVYARLEREGLIETRHGLGTFVAEVAGASTEVERIAAETVTEARKAGLSPRDVARAIYSGDWATDQPAGAGAEELDIGHEADEAAARRELRRQIARLEAELASHPEARPEAQPVRPALRRKGHVAGLEELEETRDELMTRLKKARTEAEKRGRREARARLRREDMAVEAGAAPVRATQLRGVRRPGLRRGPGVPEVRARRRPGRLVAREGLVGMSVAFLPVKGVFEQVGSMVILTAKTLSSSVRRPFPYGGEFVAQFLFALQLCWFPMAISMVAVSFGAPGLQAANFLTLFGALDRLGGFFVLASIREFAPFVTAIIVAGVAGTAITADLGARKIREELDALQVLGVDPIKNIVVPRFLALMLITALLDVYAMLFGIAGGILAELAYGQPLGGFFATLFTNASITDLWGSLLKCTLFGAIVAIVCCYKGMNASGGPEGVGKAVNQAVVLSLLAVFAFNYVFTQTLLATHPEISQIK